MKLINNYLDLTGHKYNRLTVIDIAYHKKGVYWNCVCDCGNKIIAKGAYLRNGHTKSCGCYANDKRKEGKHHLTGTPTYTTWDSMIQRCTNQNNHNFQFYGELGITICEKWLDFQGFIEDMGLRPPNLTLDRINGNKGYYKENCRWVSMKRQSNNTKRNIYITYNGKKQTLSAWCEELGINDSTLHNRLFRAKWTIEKAFTEPVQTKRRG